MKEYRPLFAETSEGIYEPVSVEDVINFFLYYYEGLEHMTEHGITNPETWYTVTTILRRNLEHIKAAR